MKNEYFEEKKRNIKRERWTQTWGIWVWRRFWGGNWGGGSRRVALLLHLLDDNFVLLKEALGCLEIDFAPSVEVGHNLKESGHLLLQLALLSGKGLLLLLQGVTVLFDANLGYLQVLLLLRDGMLLPLSHLKKLFCRLFLGPQNKQMVVSEPEGKSQRREMSR